MDKLHENIRRVRINSGYSQDEIADKMGIERSTYSNFELGKTRLLSRNMSKFSNVTGLSEEEILLGDAAGRGYLSEGVLSERIDALSANIDGMASQLEALTAAVDKLRRKLGK